jgi:hypothetical protein
MTDIAAEILYCLSIVLAQSTRKQIIQLFYKNIANTQRK